MTHFLNFICYQGINQITSLFIETKRSGKSWAEAAEQLNSKGRATELWSWKRTFRRQWRHSNQKRFGYFLHLTENPNWVYPFLIPQKSPFLLRLLALKYFPQRYPLSTRYIHTYIYLYLFLYLYSCLYSQLGLLIVNWNRLHYLWNILWSRWIWMDSLYSR